jgi:hypothetical protein
MCGDHTNAAPAQRTCWSSGLHHHVQVISGPFLAQALKNDIQQHLCCVMTRHQGSPITEHRPVIRLTTSMSRWYPHPFCIQETKQLQQRAQAGHQAHHQHVQVVSASFLHTSNKRRHLEVSLLGDDHTLGQPQQSQHRAQAGHQAHNQHVQVVSASFLHTSNKTTFKGIFAV